MTVTLLFTVGPPVIFLGIQLLFHLADPRTYGPAGSPSTFASLGNLMAQFVVHHRRRPRRDSRDNRTDRQHVPPPRDHRTRSRLALWLACIPADLKQSCCRWPTHSEMAHVHWQTSARDCTRPCR